MYPLYRTSLIKAYTYNTYNTYIDTHLFVGIYATLSKENCVHINKIYDNKNKSELQVDFNFIDYLLYK